MQEYKGGNPNKAQKSDYRENLSNDITYEIENEVFESRCRDGREGVSYRDRKLTLKNLIVLIINFKSSVQRELDRFFKAVSKNDFNIREVTKGALTQARAKLNPWAFKRLNQVAIDSFYSHAEYYGWLGMRLLSVDGTRLMLPNHPTVVEEFGQQNFGPNADSKRSMATVSVLYDAFNHLCLDAEIAPYTTSESELLVRHLEHVKAGDLLLLDRGYPSFWLLFLLKAKGTEFCVRLKEDWWLKVKGFAQSAELERVVSFKLPKKDRSKLSAYPEFQDIEIQCRLVKVELPTGEQEILCTSLLDTETYKHEQFAELYHYRWNEEEAFKLLKNRVELEQFSGKTAKAVKQDFFAKVFLMTLCAAYAHPIEEKVIAEYKADEKRKHDQKINRTNALSMTQDILISVFIRKQFSKAIKAFDKVVSQTREIIMHSQTNFKVQTSFLPLAKFR